MQKYQSNKNGQQKIKRLHVNEIDELTQTCRFHPRGRVDCVPKQAVPGHLVTNNASYTRALRGMRSMTENTENIKSNVMLLLL